ncbi:MAG: transposase family protein [Nitrososphaerales archaeon]
MYDRSVRRWRHLDLGAARCLIEAEICRVDCRRCKRVRTEEVPWARPCAWHTRDFQDIAPGSHSASTRPRSRSCFGSPGKPWRRS